MRSVQHVGLAEHSRQFWWNLARDHPLPWSASSSTATSASSSTLSRFPPELTLDIRVVFLLFVTRLWFIRIFTLSAIIIIVTALTRSLLFTSVRLAAGRLGVWIVRQTRRGDCVLILLDLSWKLVVAHGGLQQRPEVRHRGAGFGFPASFPSPSTRRLHFSTRRPSLQQRLHEGDANVARMYRMAPTFETHCRKGRTMETKQEENALSWQEVQEICAEMENLYRKDAQKDAMRLRSLIQKRKEISATVQAKRNDAQRQLSHLLTNVGEWERQTAASQARKEQLDAKLQELESLKREMVVQLERLRVDEQSSKESLDQLLDKYEATRQEVLKYEHEHRHDVDRAKHFMSLFAAVTGIKWDFSGEKIAGEIHAPSTKRIVPFEIDPEVDQFTAANSLWDSIDEAFDGIDPSL